MSTDQEKPIVARQIIGVSILDNEVVFQLKPLGKARLEAAKETLEGIGKIVTGERGVKASELALQIDGLIAELEGK